MYNGNKLVYRPLNNFDSLLNLFDYPGKKEECNCFLPPSDIWEEEKAIRISMEIPGVKKEDVKVVFEDETLTISGEKKPVFDNEKVNLYRRERYSGKFSRTFTIKMDIDSSAIEAEITDGILHVSIPKIVKQEINKEIKIK
ncbi:MAG TPA: Hsp20/alpha crystallin family protein [Ignavibacteriaceae bacterium]|nr:Hsp20/alpha crystallin family protein [Ignavibacteriaceae bacterium]